MTMCLMVRDYNSRSWTFPRGKVNQDEQPIDCAVREVLEETGFNAAGLVNEADSLEAVGPSWAPHAVKLYIVRDVDVSTSFQTHTRKEISKIAWKPLSALPRDKRSPNSNQYFMVTPFVSLIQKWIANNCRGIARLRRSFSEPTPEPNIIYRSVDLRTLFPNLSSNFTTHPTLNMNKVPESDYDSFNELLGKVGS